MKKLLLSLVLVSATIITSAQGLSENFFGVNVGFHGIEATYDAALSNRFVWKNGLGAGMGMRSNNSAEYRLDVTLPAVFVKSEMKYIYNLAKRSAKGKVIERNSGNYVALQCKYSFGRSNDYSLNRSVLTEVHWGLQRSLGGGFYMNTHVGLGVLSDFDNKKYHFSPTLGLIFGCKLF